ncbi:MAG TPA: alpha/beta hydrolase [Methylococcus sp.]|nr:alpha/beta hydrolase [Methylococcus sp.]
MPRVVEAEACRAVLEHSLSGRCDMRLGNRSLLLPLLFLMLCGCTHRQFVKEPYPRWGEEITLERPDRSAPLILRYKLPPEPTRTPACLLIVHGMNEYVGRYGDIVHHFARRFLVAGFDLYAHGLSNPVLRQADRALTEGAAEQEVSDAYLAQLPLRDLEPMRQDLEIVLHRLIPLCDELGAGRKPVFILSHSLGSLVAASYLLKTRPKDDPGGRVRGIVLLGPAFSVSQVPGRGGWLANPLIRLSFHAEEHFLNPGDEPWPLMLLNQAVALATVPLLDGLFEVLSWPGMRQWFTPVTPDWVVNYLTDWEEERARHRADGWIIRRSLLRYVKGVEKEIVHFRRGMSAFATPYYLVYSGQDPITPPWGAHDFARVTLHRHPDNQLLPLPDLYHHEHLYSAPPLRAEILQRIDGWLDRRLSSLHRETETPP